MRKGWLPGSLVAGALALAPDSALAQSRELPHQERLCAGMVINRYLPESGGEADCISDTHAIEVEFSEQWASAIGQSLHYAAMTRLASGIILICRARTREETCLRHRYRLESTMAHWGIAMTIWECSENSPTLADCRRLELPLAMGAD